MSDPNSEFPKPLDDPKQDARLARLSVKKISEEKLRRELATIAHAKCSEYGKAFSDCSQREGFKVVFTCRDECAALKDCVSKYYNEPEFNNFLVEKGYDPATIKKRKILDFFSS
eukprot:gene5080-5445_t